MQFVRTGCFTIIKTLNSGCYCCSNGLRREKGEIGLHTELHSSTSSWQCLQHYNWCTWRPRRKLNKCACTCLGQLTKPWQACMQVHKVFSSLNDSMIITSTKLLPMSNIQNNYLSQVIVQLFGQNKLEVRCLYQKRVKGRKRQIVIKILSPLTRNGSKEGRVGHLIAAECTTSPRQSEYWVLVS